MERTKRHVIEPVLPQTQFRTAEAVVIAVLERLEGVFWEGQTVVVVVDVDVDVDVDTVVGGPAGQE